MKPIALVTQAEYDKAASVFAATTGLDCRPAPADEAALAARVRATGCRIVVLGVAPYREPLYDALAENAGGGGALIVRFGFGTDGINLSRRTGRRFRRRQPRQTVSHPAVRVIHARGWALAYSSFRRSIETCV